MFFLSCVCYASVDVCLYVPCGHLLGKGCPLGSRLWCLTVSLLLSIGILGQVWYLVVSIPDLCTLTYFAIPWMVVANCATQDHPLRKPCCLTVRILLSSKCRMMLL